MSIPSSLPRWSNAAGRVDDILFHPHTWFALDYDNYRIRRVVVPTRTAGLQLVLESPRVASIVGTLRPGFRVVDVDVDGPDGTMLARRISVWLSERHLWHLSRPSGGAPGRHHVFLAHGDHLPELLQYVARLRAEKRLGAKKLEVREQVRPLCAPHRTGTFHAPTGSLTQALAALPSPEAIARHPTGGPRHRVAEVVPSVTALLPAARRRRDLPAPWLRYLATGDVPPIGGSDTGRSTIGLRVSHELLLAGYSAEEAWDVIASAHPCALTHARSPGRGRAWWTQYVWNHLVHEDHLFRAGHDVPAPLTLVVNENHRTVEAARAALNDVQYQWGPRVRHSIRLVAETILDRMLRNGELTVPCPQRDLCLDTGLSRPTVSKALRALHGPLGSLEETFDPAQRETSSHTFTLKVERLQVGVGHSLPPVSHTPGGGGAWKLLGPPAHSLWRVLHGSRAAGLGLEEVAMRSGFAASPSQHPSPDQARTVRRHLQALAVAGLASCDDAGAWHIAHSPTEEFVAAADRVMAPVREQITHERTAYRTAPGTEWRRARAATIEREREKARARYDEWMARHSPAQLRARATQLAEDFHQLTSADQYRLKARWAQRRIQRNGPSEARRHDEWCQSLDPQTYTERAIERAVDFARLPPPERANRVHAWREHRTRWNIPEGHPDDRRPTAATRAGNRPALDAAQLALDISFTKEQRTA